MKNSIMNTAGPAIRVITFIIGEEVFAVEIGMVREILRPPPLTPVPKGPPFLSGIANIRGTIIPVIDANLRLKRIKTQPSTKTRILVLQLNGELAGLTVDEVREVRSFAKSDLSEPPQLVRGIDKFFLSCIIRIQTENQLVMLLNLEEVFHFEGRISENPALEGSRPAELDARQMTKVEEEKMVSFFLGEEEFAFPINGIKEILQYFELTVVPNVPDFVLGIQSIRNEIIPVIDMRRLMKMPDYEEEIADLFEAMLRANLDWFTRIRMLLSGLEANETCLEDDQAGLAGYLVKSRRNFLGARLADWIKESLSKLVAALENVKALFSADRAKASALCESEFHREFELFQELIRSLKGKTLQHIRKNRKILIIENEQTVFGLMIDRINEVIRVDKEFIDTAPELLGAHGRELGAIAKLEQGARLIMVLDQDSLIDQDDLQIISRIHAEEKKKKADQTLSQEESRQFVIFSVRREEFAVSIEHVREIFRSSEITQVPKAPKFIVGVTNMRGTIIPVVDNRQLLGWRDNVSEFKDMLEALQRNWKSSLENARIKKKSTRTTDPLKAMERQFNNFSSANENVSMHFEELKKSFFHYLGKFRALPLNGVEQVAGETVKELREAKTRFQKQLDDALDLSGKDLLKNGTILIVSALDLVFGLLVDEIREVAAIASERIEKTPALVDSDLDAGYLQGIAKLAGGQRIVLLLNVEAVLNKTQLSGLRRLQKQLLQGPKKGV